MHRTDRSRVGKILGQVKWDWSVKCVGLHIQLPEDVYEKIRYVAYKERKSLNTVIIESLAKMWKYASPGARKSSHERVKPVGYPGRMHRAQ